MITSLILASALAAPGNGGCPKPLPHHHRRVPALQCSCLDEPPRTIWLTPAPPDPDPIELGVYRYYVIAFDDAGSVDDPTQAPSYAGGYWTPDPGYPPSGIRALPAPELDLSAGWSAVGVLTLTTLIAVGRRPA